MATFLGIYSKTGIIDRQVITNVTRDFAINGTREIITKEFPGMVFCFVSKFKPALFETEATLSFISGHISFENINEVKAGTTAGKFNACISESGIALLPAMEGAFAALHYNATQHTLILVNDKFGVFPLFIFEDENYVIVSNEYQPLAQHNPNKELPLDNDAIAEFFTLGTTLGNKTFYRHIKNLPAASYTCITTRGKEQMIYWLPDGILSSTKSTKTLAHELLETFTKINRECMDAKVTDVCLLSAGADSRLILSTLTEAQRKEMLFYTSNLSFLDPKEDKDVIGATRLAEKFKLKQRVEKISFHENQFGIDYFDEVRKLREKQVYGGWHGGEFLGGYYLNAVPIKKDLDFKQADKKLKLVFSWRFRWKLKQHPYKTYLKEKEKFKGPVHELSFMIEQLTRGFFTNIYGGSRAYWLQPYQLMNHGFSPFWDSRFLQLLLQVPLNQLENYNFYNEVFKYCPKEVTEIASNSPLTNRLDSVIPKMNEGVEPKGQVLNTHHQAYTERLNDEKIWQRKIYRSKKLKLVLRNEFDTLTKQWLDFETWYVRYVRD